MALRQDERAEPILGTVKIAGEDYPCSRWQTEPGQQIEKQWTQGFAGGMGAFLDEEGRYYFADEMDASHHPFVRMPPSFASTFTPTGLDGNLPFYGVVAKQGTIFFLYLLNNRRAYKYQFSTNTIVDTNDFGAGAQVGRPAFFNGTLYVPLGDSLDAVKLTTIAAPPTTDTWTPITGIKARHFASWQRGIDAMLARAHTTNQVDLSVNGSDWTGDDFDVGDSTYGINDLVVADRQLILSKPDNFYLFDGLANAVPMNFLTLANQNQSAEDGANSAGYGPFFYWAHSSGLFRRYGDGIIPIGPEADPLFTNITLDGVSPAPSAYNSVAVAGRWLYASADNKVYFGYILESGRVVWHGWLYDLTSPGRLTISPDDKGQPEPILWLIDGTNLRRVNLAQDGAPIRTLGSNRGAASKTYQFTLPSWRPVPGKEVQLRYVWVRFEGKIGGGSVTASVRAHRENADVPETIGSVSLVGGFSPRTDEFEWTVGTKDLAERIQLAVRLVTDASYPPGTSEIFITGVGLTVMTPTIYRVRLQMTEEEMRGRGQSIDGAIKTLRDLKNSGVVAVIDLQPTITLSAQSFNAYLLDVQEQIRGNQRDGIEYLVDIILQRFSVHGSATAPGGE